ncbi:LuxR C-terminal-related transcriptional regulator [Azospirillum agricola]|uniref:LuxR C-terminal-related transcriptional regulator n=1 Tax=Azospirillum agricola TaxID=1720247 RepID=UPI000A0EF5D3|nr:response regulator transcription factor [Azospirillum agricola]SMH62395.1 two component transcriptional regulator, LuxR family [Azospirillum lipoferum]
MKILVADDHPLFRDALELSVRFEWPSADIVFIGSLEDGAFGEVDPAGIAFDLVVLDWHMPGVGDSDPISRLRTLGVRGPVAVVSGAEQPAIVMEALRCGAAAFLPKTTPHRVLAPSLKVVAEGGTVLPIKIALSLAGEEGPQPATEKDEAGDDETTEQASLTDREREVFGLLATGATNKEIAQRLDLAEVTVKFHTRRIFRKLGARNRADAVRRAQETGLFNGGPP